MSQSTAETTARVLLVDDTATNLQVLFQTLDGRGYELFIAQTGEEALQSIRQTRPDLVLLDIMMPGIDGYETCRQLKADEDLRDTTVIFMSALDDTADKVRGLELGAVDYITKPFQAEEVLAHVNTHLQIRRLTKALERTNAELEQSVARMKRDLDAAADVQKAILPKALPRSRGYTFAWEYHPCDELAGDALNLIPFDERHIGIYVVDVSGHGVPAALLAMSVTHSLAHRGEDAVTAGHAIASPTTVVARLNQHFQMERQANRYFTMIYGILDRSEHAFRYVAAGHPGPIVLRPGQSVEPFDSTGLPVGIVPEDQFEENTVHLQPGDRMYLFSDGMLEEMNASREQFGQDRLYAAVEAVRHLELSEGLPHIVQSLRDWSGRTAFSDDVTLLGVERGPT